MEGDGKAGPGADGIDIYRAAFDAAPVGIISAHAGRALAFNGAYLRLFGYEPGDVGETGPDRRLAPEEVHSVLDWIRRLVAGETLPRERETIGVRKDGTRFPLLLRLEVVTVGGQRLPVAFLTDRSALEEADAARLRSEADLRNIIEHSPDGILVTSQSRILFANGRLATMLRHSSADALIGLPALSFVAEPAQDAARERMQSMFATGKPAPPVERDFRRADGTTLPVELIPTGLITFQGEPAAFVVVRDISARRAMQARLLLADRLATVGTLSTAVAHEINNPLAYVAGNVAYVAARLDGVLAGVPAAEEMRAALLEASEGAERLREVVQRLRSFARVDDARIAELDVRAALEAALRMAHNEIRHRARVVLHLDPVPPVRATEAQLGQVFLNLLVNAAQAIGEGAADRHRIEVVTSAMGDRVVIEVRDSGPGIPADVLPRIFDPFFTTKPVGSGTGLGLSICHSIVTELGGTIAAESPAGGGTLFRVSLPAAPGPAPAYARTNTPVPLTPGPRAAEILVIDDEPPIGELLRRVLGPHKVTVATSGSEGLALCLDRSFDLVLCDLMMPDVSGMDIYERVRQAKPGRESRLVFMTGGAVTPRARAFVAEVSNRHLNKPFDFELLDRMIGEALGGANANPGSP